MVLAVQILLFETSEIDLTRSSQHGGTIQGSP